MTAAALVAACNQGRPDWQLLVNELLDELRRGPPEVRARAMAEGPERDGRFEGLVSAVVSSVCREQGLTAPAWTRVVRSPEPFFVFPADGFPMRVRLMLESPPAFRTRNVFVPENYLSRA